MYTIRCCCGTNLIRTQLGGCGGGGNSIIKWPVWDEQSCGLQPYQDAVVSSREYIYPPRSGSKIFWALGTRNYIILQLHKVTFMSIWKTKLDADDTQWTACCFRYFCCSSWHLTLSDVPIHQIGICYLNLSIFFPSVISIVSEKYTPFSDNF